MCDTNGLSCIAWKNRIPVRAVDGEQLKNAPKWYQYRWQHRFRKLKNKHYSHAIRTYADSKQNHASNIGAVNHFLLTFALKIILKSVKCRYKVGTQKEVCTRRGACGHTTRSCTLTLFFMFALGRNGQSVLHFLTDDIVANSQKMNFMRTKNDTLKPSTSYSARRLLSSNFV